MLRIHCSYHKCLTSYFQKIMHGLNELPGYSYKHFKSHIDDFSSDKESYYLSSLNNQFVESEQLTENCTISRFVRDPRDLIVSGYYYHRRGSEPWTKIVNPSEDCWTGVNGTLPSAIGSADSFSSYLARVPKEDGLIAQIDFRQKHFESMRKWNVRDKSILLLRYEDIVHNEVESFSDLFEFHKLPNDVTSYLLDKVDEFSMRRQVGKSKHIRNPEPGQWREHFSPKVIDYFDSRYSDLINLYGY